MKLVRIRPSRYAKMSVTDLRKRCVKGDRQACSEVYWRTMYPEATYKPVRRGDIRGTGGVVRHKRKKHHR